ncbi:MAG TPA: hypothetical protein VGI92_10675 [Gemmatimonadales bacterium]
MRIDGAWVRAGALVLVCTAASASQESRPDRYHWDFEGGNDIEASGPFVASNNRPFLSATAWLRDTVVFLSGKQSVRQDYPVRTGNVGAPFFYHDRARKKVFIRFAYRQSRPFNLFRGVSNGDQVKLLRAKNRGNSGDPWALMISNTLGSSPGRLEFRFPDAAPGMNLVANTNLPAPNMNSLLGTWVHFEVMVDMQPNALTVKISINGRLYFDYTGARAIARRSEATPEWYQFRGTTNSMQSASSDWVDDINISGEPTGQP